MAKPTIRQLEMLRDYADSNEATDFSAFHDRANGSALAWRNRERVIDALHKRGALDADGITAEGRATLAAAVAAGRIQLYKGQTL